MTNLSAQIIMKSKNKYKIQEGHDVHFPASIHDKFIRIASRTSEYAVARMRENQFPYLAFLKLFIF